MHLLIRTRQGKVSGKTENAIGVSVGRFGDGAKLCRLQDLIDAIFAF